MCGICAAISDSTLTDSELYLFKTLSILSTLRGTDGSGVVWVEEGDKGLDTFYLKSMNTLAELVNGQKTGSHFASGNKIKLAFAHSRSATVGNVSVKNTHPHLFESIIGVHNGTIYNFAKEAEARGVSDSFIFFEKLQKDGIESAIEEAGASAAFSVFYRDTSNGTINYFRNDQRPLYVGKSIFNSFFFASEKWMLEQASLRDRSSSVRDIKEVPTGVLFSINKNNVMSEKKLDFPVMKRVYTDPYKSAYGICDWEQDLQDYDSISVQDLFKEEKDYGAISLGSESSVPLLDSRGAPMKWTSKSRYSGYYETKPVTEFLKLLNDGCSLCGNPQDPTDTVFWYNHKEFACKTCVSDVDTRSFFHPGAMKKGYIIQPEN